MMVSLRFRKVMFALTSSLGAVVLIILFQNCAQSGSVTGNPLANESLNSTNLKITYAQTQYSFKNSVAIANQIPVVKNLLVQETVTSWAIAPGLPAGLLFSSSSGNLSGTPTFNFPKQTFTIRATTNKNRNAEFQLQMEALPTYPVSQFNSSDSSMNCAIVKPGENVRCSGVFFYSPTGPYSTNAPQNTAITMEIEQTSGAKQIANAQYYGCAVMANEKVKCWGSNANGQLGDGTTQNRAIPVEVAGLQNIKKVGTTSYAACALNGSGEVWCWGSNSFGQLGNGSNDPKSLVPVKVTGITNAIDISALSYRVCALLATGSIKCWGDNSSGVLGNNSTDPISRIPVDVVGITNAVQVSVSGAHNVACALLDDKKVKCWGSNSSQMLGNNTITTPNSLVPVDVLGLTDVKHVSVGTFIVCALKTNNSIFCWGNNLGGTPTQVYQNDNIIDLITVNQAAFIVTNDGSVLQYSNAGLRGKLEH